MHIHRHCYKHLISDNNATCSEYLSKKNQKQIKSIEYDLTENENSNCSEVNVKNKTNINLHKEEKYKNKFNKINDNLNDSDEYYNLKRTKFNNQIMSSNECSEEEESNNHIKKIEGTFYETDSESIKSQSIMNDKDSESINSNVINYKKKKKK